MKLEKHLKSKMLEIDYMKAFEEVDDPILRKILTKYGVGLDFDSEIKPCQVVWLSKFEGYGLIPDFKRGLDVYIDVIRRCFIHTKEYIAPDKLRMVI